MKHDNTYNERSSFMDELKLGRMTNAELAEWFGIKKKTYEDNRQKKLKELEYYAEFETCWGGVNITSIDMSVYRKNRRYLLVKENIIDTWEDQELDMVSARSKRLYDSVHRRDSTISLETCARYASKGRKEDYGLVGSLKGGKKGNCKYELCKYIDGQCFPFTDAELQIKKDIFKEITKETEEANKAIKEEEILITAAYKEGKMTSEEYAEVMESNISASFNYNLYLARLESVLNCDVRRATKVMQNLFLLDEENLI